ncbi:hypothetical protein [uncultured Tessaracoccus sp.]|uniref:hypothetical protein n=1 Tax=uncultured Tessaracoccus sp. TaxID=905023 RepID=UPI0026081357|nr:hypothetical protein [uncultured Tessaracoccus sp.]
MESDIELSILEQAIIAPPVTLGSLANDLGVGVDALAPRIKRLTRTGVLEIATTSDGCQLALAAGTPAAVQATMPHSKVVDAWLLMHEAGAGRGARALHTPSEFVQIAARFARTATGLTLLLPPAPDPLAAQLYSHYLEAAKHAARQGLAPNLLIAKGLLDSAEGQRCCDAVAGLGATIRSAQHVAVPLIAWEGVGLALILPDQVIAGMLDVGAYAAAAFQAGGKLEELSRDTLIEMLSEGNTDAVSARKLGMSERQFRRHVSNLMQELGSSSRFQAGIEAARMMR